MCLSDTRISTDIGHRCWVRNTTNKFSGVISNMVQRTAARWVQDDYSYQSSATTMLNNLKWRSLEDRRSDARLCLFFKIIHGLVAIQMPPYAQHPSRVSRLSHPVAFRQIHTRFDYCNHCSFFPLAVVQWNNLPTNIAMLPSLDLFRAAVGSVSHQML